MMENREGETAEDAAREFASQILGIPPNDISQDDSIIAGFTAGYRYASKQLEEYRKGLSTSKGYSVEDLKAAFWAGVDYEADGHQSFDEWINRYISTSQGWVSVKEAEQFAMEFASYMQGECWEHDHREQKTHTLAEHLEHYKHRYGGPRPESEQI